jgi:hypothetical protein
VPVEDIEDFMPAPEAEPAFTFSFLFELPRSLRINDSSFLVAKSGEPWTGWSRSAMAFSSGFPELAAGSRPSHAVRLGQAEVRGPVPLDVATRVFRDWDKGVVPARHRWGRLLRLRLAALRGSREVRSAAAVSRFLTIEDFPEDGNFLAHEFLLGQVNDSLGILNEYLVTLAGMTDEWQISSVSRLDVQRYVPFMVTADPPIGPWGEWHDIVKVFDAHPYLQKDLPPDRPRVEVAAAATAVQAYHSGNHPFFPFVELYQSAEHHLNSGRSAQSVIASCTASEVFINTLFRVVGEALVTDPKKLAGILECPFRNQLEHHLPNLLKVQMDITDAESIAGRWWTDCYLPRNDVVHKGHKPDDAEAVAAKTATGAFTRWLGQSLKDDRRTEWIRRFAASPPPARP